MIVEVAFPFGARQLVEPEGGRVGSCVDDFSFIAFKVSKSVCILTTQAIMKLLKSKEAAAAVDVKSWPMVLDTGEGPASEEGRLVQVPPAVLTAPLVLQTTFPGRRVPRCTSHRRRRCWPTWTSACPQRAS